MTWLLLEWDKKEGEVRSAVSYGPDDTGEDGKPLKYGDVVDIATNWAFGNRGMVISLYEISGAYATAGIYHDMRFREAYEKPDPDAHLGASEKG